VSFDIVVRGLVGTVTSGYRRIPLPPHALLCDTLPSSLCSPPAASDTSAESTAPASLPAAPPRSAAAAATAPTPEGSDALKGRGVFAATSTLAGSDSSESSSSSSSSPLDLPSEGDAQGGTESGAPDVSNKATKTLQGATTEVESAADRAQAQAEALVARLEEKLRQRQGDLAPSTLTPDMETESPGKGLAHRTGSGAEYYDATEALIRAESGDNEWYDAPDMPDLSAPADAAAPPTQRPQPATQSDDFNPLSIFGFGGLGRSV